MTNSTSDIFQQRRALDLAFDALGRTNSDAELVQGAYAIADEFPVALAIAGLIRRLETPNSQLRGGLARLATFLPEGEIVSALQEYAGGRGNPPQGRVTAAMISERFLGNPLRPGTIADLQGNEDAAVQSLHDAVYEGEEDLHVLVDYVSQMQTYPAGIAQQVMQHLDTMESGLRVNLLMLIATDPRPQVARMALNRLEGLADAQDPMWPVDAAENPQRRAQRALFVLTPNLPRSAAASAEKVLRKAQFRGAAFRPQQDKLRAFLGIPHFSSAHTLDFWEFDEAPALPVTRPPVPRLAVPHLAVMLQSDMGFVAGHYSDEVAPKEYWSASLGSGSIRRGSARQQDTWHVEIPAAVGRWLLAREVQTIVDDAEEGAAGATPERLPGYYLGVLPWLWDAPRVPPDPVWLALAEGERRELDLKSARQSAGRLLALREMAHWDLLDAVLTGPQRNLYRGKLRDEIAPIFFAQIAAPEVQAVLTGRMQAALRVTAVWLHFAGKHSLAEETADLAYNLGAWTPEENPLMRKMLGM